MNVPITQDHLETLFRGLGLEKEIVVHTLEPYQRAFVHRSYSMSLKIPFLMDAMEDSLIPFQAESNERDEYLGDALLGGMVGLYLIDRFQEADEGILTKLRTRIVNGKRLSDLCVTLGLNRFILLSQEVERNLGRKVPSILANVVEAFVAAIFHDQRQKGGVAMALGKVQLFVARLLETKIDFSDLLLNDTNFKDLLLKHFQKMYKTTPLYKEVAVEGPPHERRFTVSVHHVDGSELGQGHGTTKREAQQEAARRALKQLGL